MKHLIIANSKAGESTKISFDVEKEAKKDFEGLDYEIYLTKGPKDATAFLKDYFKKHTDDITRVYACGGDGTIHECVNGIIGAKNAELAIVPVGTGNDFVKYYGVYKENIDEYRHFKPLINAESHPIDLTKISGGELKEPWYSINVINFGFDAIVGAMGNYYKEHGVPEDKISKKHPDPYDYALNHDAMKHGRFNDTEVFADGEKLNNKQILLATLAQGKYVGGQFCCAPKSINNDGLIDVCVLKTMTLLGLGMIIGTYTKGKHLDRKRRKIVYRRAKKVEIVAPHPIDICIDGEMTKGDHFEVEVVPGAINLVTPSK